MERLTYDWGQKCKGRKFADVEEACAKNKIIATFRKDKSTTLLGWNNEIKRVGTLYCDNPDDREKALTLLKECGYNYCKIIENSPHSIEVMYDTSRDDWGIKVY